MAEKIYNTDKMTGEEKLSLLRKIVREHQYQKIKEHGHIQTLDAFTASAILKVYDNIKEENKKKLMSVSFGRQADISWKLLKKVV